MGANGTSSGSKMDSFTNRARCRGRHGKWVAYHGPNQPADSSLVGAVMGPRRWASFFVTRMVTMPTILPPLRLARRCAAECWLART